MASGGSQTGAAGSAGPGPSGPRLTLRAFGIAYRFARHGLRWLLGWLALLVTFSGRERRRAWFGQAVLDLFRDLGATFIKLGQIMSTRPDLVPEHVRRALEHLQDDVGPFPFEAVRRTVRDDLGRPVDEIFAELSPVPIASASVAQVHKARLPDGRIVAVKVRRPDVVDLCRFDLAVLRRAAGLVGALPFMGGLDPIGAVDQFGSAIGAQLDFRIEARNNARFRRNFAGQREVVFPEVIEELSSERLLTMTFIEGSKVLATRGTRSDSKMIARLGLRVLMKMIFEDGFVHADMHPGNIFITPDDRMALLDLGLVGELDDPHRRLFARFFAAWARRDGDTMARLMYDMAPRAGHSPEAFERYRAEIIAFVGRYWGMALGDVHLGKVLFDLMGILRRHRVRVGAAFTTVNIAIAVTEGIGRQLDPGLDLMAEALPWFMTHPVDGTGGTGAGAA